MKLYSYLYEIPLFYAILVALNYFRFPEYPGFLEINPHPYWLGILLFSFRYGTFAGAITGILSTVTYIIFIWLEGDRYLFGDFHFYLLPSLFIIIGTLIGIGVDKYIQINKKQKKELIKLSGDKIHLYQELKSQRVITNELEKRIVTKTSTLVTLYEGARRLDTVEFEDLYKSIVLFFSKTLDVKEAAIYLKDNNKWKLKRSLGWENEDSWPKEYALNDGLVGLSGSGGKVLNIKNFLGKDVERQKIQVTDSQPQLDIKRECLMAGPLKKGENGNVIGVFSIQAIPLLSLNSATVNLFSFLLNWASRSLGTAYFFEEMKKQEILDPELEIYSFRYFETRFKQEFLRSRTYYLPLSIALITITGTDNFPPPKKKSVMTAISHLLKDSCRDIDVIASFPDPNIPFACLLTTTTAEKSSDVKKVIFDNFEKLNLDKSVRLHIGISSYTPKTKSIEDFLNLTKEELHKEMENVA